MEEQLRPMQGSKRYLLYFIISLFSFQASDVAEGQMERALVLSFSHH